MKKSKLITIGGVARAGKDSLAICIKKYYEEKGISVSIESLAAPLKSALADFVWQEFEIDVFGSGKEKEIIRPLMVAYGFAQRKISNGRYFTNRMDRKILASESDVVIIPDLRYADYKRDEIDWAKEKSALIIHVEKTFNGLPIEGINEDEKRNDPKIKSAANYLMTWPGDLSEEERYEEFLKCELLKDFLDDHCGRGK